STRSGSAQRLHSARGNVDLVTSVSFALPQGQYYWSVQAIDGSFAASEFAAESVANVVGKGGETSSDTPPDVPLFDVGEPYPNPSSGAVALEYSLPGGYRAGEAVITVFDILGSVVLRTSPVAGPGTNVWLWDGRGASGAQLGSGLYFMQVRTATDT